MSLDLQDAIEIKARELHNEHCVKDCEQVIGSWWLTWAAEYLAIEQAAALTSQGDTDEGFPSYDGMNT